MTFCIAMKVKEGIVGLADTQVTMGFERTTAKKIAVFERKGHSMFIMTSGLRSARDKAITYFTEVIETQDENFKKLYQAVNAFAAQVRRVSAEDKAALAESGLFFNLNCIIGGQLEQDSEHKLYLVYPEANWIEVTEGTPYLVIGESAYGKSLLDRALRHESDMRTALKIGVVAFDATRRSATDVDFPLDVVLYKNGSFQLQGHRYEFDDLSHVTQWWQKRIAQSIQELPSDWVEQAMKPLPEGTVKSE